MSDEKTGSLKHGVPYYWITLHNRFGETFECEVQDVIMGMVGGDWNLGNIVKATRRLYELSKGNGKEGTSVEYDADKINFFTKQHVLNVQRSSSVGDINE